MKKEISLIKKISEDFNKCHINDDIADSELSQEGLRNRYWDRGYNKAVDDLFEIIGEFK